MKISKFSFFVIAIVFLSFFAAGSVKAQNAGKLFTVNHNGDTTDANVGDGVCADSNGNCTLRAAIEEANATPAQDAVNFALPVPSTIDLTLGEITISTSIYIIGPGARKLTVQRSPSAGTPQFRIFGVQPSNGLRLPPTTIRGMSIKNGNVSGDGGAIYTEYNSALQLTEVSITNNTAAASAGAVFSAGVLNVTRSLIASNTANGLFAGGIVAIAPENSYITNSTLTNNTGGQGGAIYNAGNLTLVNDTISHNTARDAGSSVANGSTGTVNVFNTIIGMDNTAVSSLSGAFNSLGNNLITDARNSTGFTNGTNGDQVSDNNAINPLLGALADNDGQTDTRALLAGSPAIDHGNGCVFNRNCQQPLQNIRLFSDQRANHIRQSGTTVDVGAFEISTGSFSSFGSLGIFLRPSAAGSLVVATRASTNEKTYSIVRSTGGATVQMVGREVYIIEIKSKRAGLSSLLIFDPDGFVLTIPFLNAEFEQNGIKLTWNQK
jgi:hypothetical protein